jgi:hypothetical protein
MRSPKLSPEAPMLLSLPFLQPELPVTIVAVLCGYLSCQCRCPLLLPELPVTIVAVLCCYLSCQLLLSLSFAAILCVRTTFNKLETNAVQEEILDRYINKYTSVYSEKIREICKAAEIRQSITDQLVIASPQEKVSFHNRGFSSSPCGTTWCIQNQSEKCE